ncbi:hypothetical protein, partial [Falsihalocynthiibacter sp. CO-5D18]|uniref:hypothetical protein n=1 Tax=Falsihalocynthiibacter sp. CO-5D18 TaxID=3240872 RepID=UPI00350FE8B3
MQHQLEHFSVVPATKDPQNRAASPHQKTSKVNADQAFKKKRQVPKFDETLSSVSISWGSIKDLGPRKQLSTIRKFVKVAAEAGKKTVTIENIAIYNPYDVNSATKFYLNEEHPTDYSHLPCER